MERKKHHEHKKHKKKGLKFTKLQIGIISFAVGVGLIYLYIYTQESAVALGGLVAHLWVTALPVVEDT